MPHPRSYARRLLAPVLLTALVTGAPPPAAAGEAPSSAVVTAAPGPAAAGQVPPIPDSAILQPQDLGGAAPSPAEEGTFRAIAPPRPCATAAPAAPPRADRTVSVVVDVDGGFTSLIEHVTRYRSDGARVYMRELRAAVRDCVGWSVLESRFVGDDALLLARREYLEFAGVYQTIYLVVARTGRVVVALTDIGWETGSGHRAVVRDLSAVAVRRAATANQPRPGARHTCRTQHGRWSRG